MHFLEWCLLLAYLKSCLKAEHSNGAFSETTPPEYFFDITLLNRIKLSTVTPTPYNCTSNSMHCRTQQVTWDVILTAHSLMSSFGSAKIKTKTTITMLFLWAQHNKQLRMLLVPHFMPLVSVSSMIFTILIFICDQSITKPRTDPWRILICLKYSTEGYHHIKRKYFKSIK